MNQTRRDFLKRVTVATLAGMAGHYTTLAEPSKRPNIIFLLTDDQRDNTFNGMGHPWVKTPNVDQLLKKSVWFNQTYIAEPTCSPSRTALFTGLHERVNGIGFSSSYELTEEQWEQTYPALLQKNGYYTGFIGKFGVEYYTFRGNADKKFDYWRGHDGWARFFPKTAANCTEYSDSDKDIITPIMSESIQRFLQTAPDNKPFCLSVSFSVPHGSQTTSMYPDNPEARKMMIPANENPRLKGHPIYDELYRNIDFEIPEDCATDPYRYIPKRVLDQSKGRATRTYPYAYHPKSCHEHHIRYYQTITGMDKAVGEMMATLNEKGLADNTVIIFASDHGLLMGEYGMGGKALLYDLTSKIPCFVYDPDMPEERQGQTFDHLVSSLDITSTILDYGNVPVPKEMQGSSLKPLVYNPDTPWRQELFLENLYTGRDNPFCEGIRKGPWKYIRMFDGKDPYDENDVDFTGRTPDFEQLFNLDTDPEEKINLIDRYENSSFLIELREKCQLYSDKLNQKRRQHISKHQISRREG